MVSLELGGVTDCSPKPICGKGTSSIYTSHLLHHMATRIVASPHTLESLNGDSKMIRELA